MRFKSLMLGALVAFSGFHAIGKGGTNNVAFTAAAQGDVAKLKELFAAATNHLTIRDDLLRTAANNGQTEAVEFLIAQGADVNAKGFFNMTPLAEISMYSTRNDEKSVAAAEFLIAHGAEVDPVDQYGATPLLHAVEANKISLAHVLLSHGAAPGQKSEGRYFTPLHFAMQNRNTNMIKLLLDFKAPANFVDPDGTTPLMRAVAAKNYGLTRLFLEHGVAIPPPRNVPGTRKQSEQYWFMHNDNMERTPLLWAMMRRDTNMLALLLEFNAPINAIDVDGRTPLHYAAEGGSTNLIKMLLDAKAAVDIKDVDGATPLFLAETMEHKAAAEMLRAVSPATGITMPSREVMQDIARRICAGDATAFVEFTNIYAGMASSPRDAAHRTLNADRIQAAGVVIGDETAKGNSRALQVLKQCLDDKKLKYFALDPLGIAAAAGNQESLGLLLHCHEKSGILENSVCFALAPAAKANQSLAVDYFATLALDPEISKKQFYGVGWLIKETLGEASTKGNEKAKQALEKFLVVYTY